MPGGKRKRNDLPPQYDAGGYIPQQDGSGDAASGNFEIEVWTIPFLLRINFFFNKIYIYIS